jgi:hypothetical protein
VINLAIELVNFHRCKTSLLHWQFHFKSLSCLSCFTLIMYLSGDYSKLLWHLEERSSNHIHRHFQRELKMSARFTPMDLAKHGCFWKKAYPCKYLPEYAKACHIYKLTGIVCPFALEGHSCSEDTVVEVMRMHIQCPYDQPNEFRALIRHFASSNRLFSRLVRTSAHLCA